MYLSNSAHGIDLDDFPDTAVNKVYDGNQESCIVPVFGTMQTSYNAHPTSGGMLVGPIPAAAPNADNLVAKMTGCRVSGAQPSSGVGRAPTALMALSPTTSEAVMSDSLFAKWARCHIFDTQVAEAYVAEYKSISRKSKSMKGTVQDIIGKLKDYDDKIPWLTSITSMQWIQKNIHVMGVIHAAHRDESYDQTCFELDEWYPTVDPMKAFWVDQKKVFGLVEKLSMAVYFLYNEHTAKQKIQQRASAEATCR